MDEMGMTIEVSQWIVKTACEAAKNWNALSGITRRLTLNISAKYYANSLFVNSICNIIEETKLPPKCLELEITESLIMHDSEYSLKTIKQLQEHGVDITIDNFGTGFSSLSYLHQFAVNSIKTDRKFTKALTQDAETTNFLRAMINLAKNLKIKVQAEGVETKEQYNLLFEMGCDEAQGYYIGHPMPYEDLINLIKNTDKQLQELN
jgi:EAL domain-containing protein (putative c-di-GMP-specific phosphodiesterase class I)